MGSIRNPASCFGTWGVGWLIQGSTCGDMLSHFWVREPPDGASICSWGTGGNTRMAITFIFLGAKTDPCTSKVKEMARARFQTGHLQKDPFDPEGVIGVGGGLSRGTGCRQKEALCLQLTFDATVTPGQVKLRILPGPVRWRHGPGGLGCMRKVRVRNKR